MKYSYTNTTVTKTESQCHEGFTEIYPGIYVGRKWDVERVMNKVDVLIPLDSVHGSIWEDGYTGEIMYIPIEDYSVLPKWVEAEMVNKVLDLLMSDKKVAIFCIGGHGRTGYFTSLLLGKLGIEDPIDYLRKNYCEKAVEAKCQVEAIANFLDRPELIERYRMTEREIGFRYNYNYSGYSLYNYTPQNTCGTCLYYSSSFGGYCHRYDVETQSSGVACRNHIKDELLYE